MCIHPYNYSPDQDGDEFRPQGSLEPLSPSTYPGLGNHCSGLCRLHHLFLDFMKWHPVCLWKIPRSPMTLAAVSFDLSLALLTVHWTIICQFACWRTIWVISGLWRLWVERLVMSHSSWWITGWATPSAFNSVAFFAGSTGATPTRQRSAPPWFPSSIFCCCCFFSHWDLFSWNKSVIPLGSHML